MAKRIQVKGKPPRGLSKAQRIILDESKKLSANPFTLTRDLNKNWSNTRQKMESAGKDVSSRPSSTRKKLVKEGNPRFIGPRTLESEVAEDAATKFRESFGPSRAGEPTPAYVMRNVGKKGNLPRISKPKKKTASGTNSRIKTLIALKRLSESGRLPGEVGRMLRDIPGI